MNFKELTEKAHKEAVAQKQKEAADRAEKNKQEALAIANRMATSFFKQFKAKSASYTALARNNWSGEFIAVVAVPDTDGQYITEAETGNWRRIHKSSGGEYYIDYESDPLCTLDDFYREFFE